MVFPLFVPVLMGGVFAALLLPMVPWFEKRKWGRGSAAALLTLGLTLLFLLPASFLIFIAVKAVSRQLAAFRDLPENQGEGILANLAHSPQIEALFQKASDWFSVSPEEVLNTVSGLARSIGIKAADMLGEFLTQLPGLTVAALVMVISVYFFLLDAERIGRFTRRISVFGPGETDRLLSAFTGLCRSVLVAALVSGIAQCLLFTLGLLLSGNPQTGLISLLVLLTSFLPLVGSAPVAFGTALYTFFALGRGDGVVLLVFAVLASLVDNFIRPAVLRGSANLHPLIAFLSAFGGLQVIGFAGIFLGPIIAGLGMTVLDELSRERPLEL